MTQITIDTLIDDIPADTARAAHQWSSFTPEDRGDRERRDYAATLARDFATFSALANTDEKRATLAEEFERYRAGYRQRILARLSADSRCASTMITGGANFPARRNEKANAVARKRSEEVVEYRTRALAAIRKKLQPELAPIALGDADAGDRIRLKLEALEKKRLLMKAANAVIRKERGNAEGQVRLLLGLGFGDTSARKLLEPDFAGRVGFADYELTNTGAEIRRLKKRLEAVERNKATETVEVESSAGIRFEDCPAENRVRLFFPGKPDASVRSDLKSSGFRWAPSIGAWQAYRNHGTVQKAKRIAGVEL